MFGPGQLPWSPSQEAAGGVEAGPTVGLGYVPEEDPLGPFWASKACAVLPRADVGLLARRREQHPGSALSACPARATATRGPGLGPASFRPQEDVGTVSQGK